MYLCVLFLGDTVFTDQSLSLPPSAEGGWIEGGEPGDVSRSALFALAQQRRPLTDAVDDSLWVSREPSVGHRPAKEPEYGASKAGRVGLCLRGLAPALVRGPLDSQTPASAAST
jgi:hypothetical protein